MLSIQWLEAISLTEHIHPLNSAYCISISHSNDLSPPSLPRVPPIPKSMQTHLFDSSLFPKNF